MTTPWGFIMRMIGTILFKRNLKRASAKKNAMRPMKMRTVNPGTYSFNEVFASAKAEIDKSVMFGTKTDKDATDQGSIT